MSTTQVTKCTCDRCSRTWYEEGAVKTAELQFEYRNVDKKPTTTCYETLCAKCAKVIEAAVATLGRVRAQEE